MKVIKPKIGTGGYLKAPYIIEHKITELKILGDAEEVTFTGKNKAGEEEEMTKVQLTVSYEGYEDKKDMPNKWTLNNTALAALIDIWDDDTDKWVGKIASITIGGEGEMKHIKVDTLRTK